MLLGKKGKDTESGYIFAPYLVAVDPIVIGNRTSKRKAKIAKIFSKNYHYDVNVHFNPKKGFKSRYATKMINSSFYGPIGASGHPGITGRPSGHPGISGHPSITGPTGHTGHPGITGIPYKQWNRKKRIETIFNKKSS